MGTGSAPLPSSCPKPQLTSRCQQTLAPTPETQHLIWAEGSCSMEAFKAGSLLSLTGPGL